MKKYTFIIEGLHCEKCEAKVNDSIRKAVSVKSVTSSHVNGETIVLCKDSVDVTEMKKVIVGLGHKILDTKIEDVAEEKKGLFSFLKKK